MFTCLYVVSLPATNLVAKTFIHANCVKKIIISIHVSLQLPKRAYGGENVPLYPSLTFVHRTTAYVTIRCNYTEKNAVTLRGLRFTFHTTNQC